MGCKGKNPLLTYCRSLAWAVNKKPQHRCSGCRGVSPNRSATVAPGGEAAAQGSFLPTYLPTYRLTLTRYPPLSPFIQSYRNR